MQILCSTINLFNWKYLIEFKILLSHFYIANIYSILINLYIERNIVLAIIYIFVNTSKMQINFYNTLESMGNCNTSYATNYFSIFIWFLTPIFFWGNNFCITFTAGDLVSLCNYLHILVRIIYRNNGYILDENNKIKQKKKKPG